MDTKLELVPLPVADVDIHLAILLPVALQKINYRLLN